MLLSNTSQWNRSGQLNKRAGPNQIKWVLGMLGLGEKVLVRKHCNKENEYVGKDTTLYHRISHEKSTDKRTIQHAPHNLQRNGIIFKDVCWGVGGRDSVNLCRFSSKKLQDKGLLCAFLFHWNLKTIYILTCPRCSMTLNITMNGFSKRDIVYQHTL